MTSLPVAELLLAGILTAQVAQLKFEKDMLERVSRAEQMIKHVRAEVDRLRRSDDAP